MATTSSFIIIQPSTATPVVSAVTLISVAQDGDPGANRILTHPDSANFAPITYFRNPDSTSNLDNEVLTSPDAQTVKTSSSTKLIRQEGLLVDVVCEENWAGQENRRAAMPTFMFRQLYEYLINPPAFSSTAQTFIEWQPRDRSLKTYNVELFKLTVGSGSGATVFNVHELRGITGNTIQSPFEGLDVSPTGFIDQSITVHLHVISEV